MDSLLHSNGHLGAVSRILFRSLVCDQLDLSVGFDVFHYEACSKVIGSIACEEEQEERKKA